MNPRHSRSLAALFTFTLLVLRSGTARGDAPPPPPFVAGATNFGGAPTLATSSSQAVPTSLATVDPSTGEARAGYSFELLTARGDAQPSLSLGYSSSAGVGLAGLGWSLSLPAMERRGASGAPRFDSDVLGIQSPDRSSDRYVFDGLPLVPVCMLAGGGTCLQRGAADNESFPDALGGWTYFRAEIDDGQRYFYSPDGQTWVVQTKRGVTLTFGVIPDALAGGDRAVERGHDPLTPTYPAGTSALTAPLNPVYRWNLAKQTDASGNAVYYGWRHLQVDPLSGVDRTIEQGREYLTDIYDTLAPGVGAGIAGPGQNAITSFAHHVHLWWNSDGGLTTFLAQSPSWQTPPAWFLDHVDVTSSPLSGGVRQLVRRYWLKYGRFGIDFSAYQLAEIDLEGTCNHWPEDSSGLLPPATGCPRLPALAMSYSVPTPGLSRGVVGLARPYQGGAQPPYYLVDCTGIAIPWLNPPLNIVPNPSNAGTLSGVSADLLPTPGLVPRYALGDWLGDGQVDWLWFNILSTNGDQAANVNQYEVYSFVQPGLVPYAYNQLIGTGPFPLPDYLDQPSLAPHGFQPDFQTGRAMDLDGDGLTDMGLVPEGTTSGTNLRGYFTTRDALGQIHPVAQWSAMPTCGSGSLWGDLGSYYRNPAKRVLADFDGDGLVDVVVLENTQPYVDSSDFGQVLAHVFKNRGDGRFGSGGTDVPNGCDANYAYDSYDVPIPTGGGIDKDSFISYGTSIHDVNGDGLADFVWIDVHGLHVVLQQWDASTAQYSFDDNNALVVPLSSAGCTNNLNNNNPQPPLFNTSETLVQFADMDASGVDDIVTFVCGTLSWFSVAGATPAVGKNLARPGLLHTITNGVGLSTTVTYENFKDVFPAGTLGAPPPAGGPPAPAVPVPVMLVSSVETTNGLQGPNARDSVTTYSYANPVYDARDRVFVGFQTVTTAMSGDSTGPGLDTVTHFANGTYPVSPGHGAPANADYGFRIQRGLPAVVEQKNHGTSAMESTTLNVYAYETIYAGTDGRVVRQVYLAKIDQYTWDEAQQQSSTSAVKVLDEITPGAQHAYDMSVPAIQFPAAAGHTRKRFHRTAQGNEDWIIDDGNPDGPSPDRPIEVSSFWNVPQGSATEWNFRLSQTLTAYADASGSLVPPIREADFTYDSRGLPLTIASPLSGTVPLLRANPGGTPAPPPNDASQDTSVPTALLTLTYDPVFGNLIQVTGPTSGASQPSAMQCTQISYDSAFSQLPVRTTHFLGGCTGVPFTTSRAYDRGFEHVTMEVSPSLEVYSATYDAFGRLVTASAPDPSTPLHSDADPAVLVDYSKFDPPPPSNLTVPLPLPPFPLRVLAVRSNVGLPGQPAYAARWQYFDGANAQLLTVQQSETPGQVVVQGAVAVGSATGWVSQAWRPFFKALADGSTYDVQGTVPTGPSTSATYDVLGEITQTIDELKRVSKVSYTHATFSRQVKDAVQVASSQNISTTIRSDGHGRLATTTATISNPLTDNITTTFSYLATGEVTTVTKNHTASPSTYVRTMAYDTRGRMVENTEPNTSFRTLVTSSGQVSTTPHDWRYAYNDKGQLVGTSDARGCGENFEYDGLGRILGEDYSPCDSSFQPAYSPGNFVTGEGLEAFYRYDVPETTFTHAAFYRGHLTAVYDRGQNTRLQLDGRGRVTEIDRRLGGPLSFYGIAGAYSSHVFTRQFAYDEANRVVTASTGADVAELVPAAGSTTTTAYTVRGGVSAVQMPYSGGQLLGQRTFDAANNVLSEAYGSNMTPGPSQAFKYYANETLKELVTDGPLLLGGAGKGGVSQVIIQDLMLSYDQVDNPTGINDVSPTTWPAGILPAQHTAKYDDLYRVTSVTTTYGTKRGSDVFSLPYEAEVLAGSQAFPATVVPQDATSSQQGGTRVQSQSFAYDFLDNVQASTDDQSDVPDRSFGQAQYGENSLLGPVPNHLVSSSNPNGAGVAASYDAAGNTTSMTVTYATLPDGGCSNGAPPPCVSTYFYGWDEVGRLLYSVRYDGGLDSDDGIPPPATVEFTYTYDASGTRVARRANIAQTDGTRETSFSVTVFPSLRLENTSLDSSGDYELNDETEVVYLQDGAGATYGRAFYAPNDDPAAAGTGAVHVYLEFGDHLGSTAAVVDFDTGNVVEKSSYLAYGAVDADYRASSFREPYRYTGHHDDSEVGLTYFGARYYIPTLARWASPDPLTIHGLGSSLNPYSFVSGSPMGKVDPFGLAEGDDDSGGGSVFSFTFNWVPGIGGGSSDAGFPAPGSTVFAAPKAPTFAFFMWNPLTAQTFLLHNPIFTPPRAHTALEQWKGLANGALKILAFSLNETVRGLAGPYPVPCTCDVGALIPRFRLDPNDDGEGIETISTIGLGAAVVVGTGGFGGGAAVGEEVLETVGSAGVEAVEGSLGSGRAYSVAFETTLQQVGAGTRAAHFKAANTALAESLSSATLEELGISIPRSNAGTILGESPGEWTWHHVPDQPGVLQLVPRAMHRGSTWQSLLHPGGVGGFKLWGFEF